jgi:hypothetical protein
MQQLPTGIDFLSHILCPLVTVVSSVDAEEIANAYELESVIQLLAPQFNRLYQKGIFILYFLIKKPRRVYMCISKL